MSDVERIGRLWRDHILFGAVLHPFEAWLLQRSLKTFSMRMEVHNSNAKEIAEFLHQHHAVSQVFYPGLEDHPQHELAREQMTGGFGGMVSFCLRDGQKAVYQLLEYLELISLAVSLGGVHSLISHPTSTISVVQTEEDRKSTGVIDGMLRLSVGLEDSTDLIDDLDKALAHL